MSDAKRQFPPNAFANLIVAMTPRFMTSPDL